MRSTAEDFDHTWAMKQVPLVMVLKQADDVLATSPADSLDAIPAEDATESKNKTPGG